MVQAFPLKWPLGRETTPANKRKIARFETTPGRARDGLLHQLKLLGAKNVVISTNVATYRRGGQDIPYADQSSAKANPGVAVYYTWNNEQYCLACDKWNSVTDNMQALMKTVEAIRGIERWGTGEMMRTAFAGFKELPPPTPEAKTSMPWHVILEVRPSATIEEIKAAYRKKAFETHPDHGGSAERFNEVQLAYNSAQQNKK